MLKYSQLMLAVLLILKIPLYDLRIHNFGSDSSPTNEEQFHVGPEHVEIDTNGDSMNLFPNEVKLSLKVRDEQFNFNFIKAHHIQQNNNVLLKEQNEIVRKDIDKTMETSLYTDELGSAVLTLIKNPKRSQRQRHLVMATIHLENAQLTIVPSGLFNSNSNDQGYSAVFKKTHFEVAKDFDEVLISPDYQELHEGPKRRRRQVLTSPVQIFVETMVVIGPSVYNKYRSIFPTLSNELFIEYLQIHFAHVITAVDLRYTNTFATDTQLKINIRLRNILIFTNILDTPWEDRSVVGIDGVTTFNGRIVVNSIKSLNAFRNRMNTLGLSYDHATAIMNVDLWNGNTSSSSGVISSAWLSSICGSYRYSILEDVGLNLIDTFSHELGHNLGSRHDSDGNTCPTADNYLMAPSIGLTTNIANRYRFSSCSVTQFKALLTQNNKTAVSSRALCLTNVPSPMSGIYFQEGYLPGRLWRLDDQCKLWRGASSGFCTLTTARPLCQSLTCRRPSDGACVGTWGWGAVDGTPGCDSMNPNRICYKTQCVDPSTVPLIGSKVPPSCACLNGGTCRSVSRFYLCECPNGWTGLNCETLISG